VNHSFEFINAVKNNDIATVRNIINKYQNRIVNEMDYFGWTPLHWACYYGYSNIVELLLDYGADTNIRTSNGVGDDYKTPKEIAEITNNKKCVKIIKNYKMKIRTKKIISSIMDVIPK